MLLYAAAGAYIAGFIFTPRLLSSLPPILGALWYYRKDLVIRCALKLVGSGMFNDILGKVESECDSVSEITQHEKCIHIRYDSGKFNMALEHDMTREPMMIHLKVKGVKHCGSEVELTQPPGTHYGISCKKLGLNSIVVKNSMTNQEKVFTGDELLGWLDEVCVELD